VIKVHIQEIHNLDDYYKALKKITTARFKAQKQPSYIVIQRFPGFFIRRIVLKNKTIIESKIPKEAVALCTK
jgi:hypothetical protein